MIKVFSTKNEQKEAVATFSSGNFVADINNLLSSFLPKTDGDYIKRNVLLYRCIFRNLWQ